MNNDQSRFEAQCAVGDQLGDGDSLVPRGFIEVCLDIGRWLSDDV